jgi:hypothetical protein
MEIHIHSSSSVLSLWGGFGECSLVLLFEGVATLVRLVGYNDPHEQSLIYPRIMHFHPLTTIQFHLSTPRFSNFNSRQIFFRDEFVLSISVEEQRVFTAFSLCDACTFN